MAEQAAARGAQLVFGNHLLIAKISAHLTPVEILVLALVNFALANLTAREFFWKNWGEGQSSTDIRQYEHHLIHAALKGKQVHVARLVTAGVDPTSHNNRAIGNASTEGHVGIVRYLLNDGRADPAGESNCSIRFASQHGHAEVVHLLLADGRADPTIWENWAIRVASQNNRVEVVLLLLEDGRADPQVGLSMARLKNNEVLIKLLEAHIAISKIKSRNKQ